jgi:hypothetical protein
MPGRSFSGRDDFNTQLGDWLEIKANYRVHSGIRCRPSERLRWPTNRSNIHAGMWHPSDLLVLSAQFRALGSPGDVVGVVRVATMS